MKLYHIIILLFIILFSCKNTENENKSKVETEEKIEFNELDFVINDSYKIGDVRRYGVMPDEPIVKNVKTNRNAIESVIDLAEKSGIKMTFPKGFYNDGLYIKGRSNIELNFEEAEFSGPINIIENENKVWSKDIKLTGTVITYYKLFVRYAKDIEIENLSIKSDSQKNIANLRSMGCDIYAGTQYLFIKNLHIEDLGSEQDTNQSFKLTRAAIQVHGFNENPSNVIIQKILINSSDRHGIYLTGNNHQIDEIVINKFGVGSLENIQGLDDTDLLAKETNQITGVWLNKCNNSAIGSITINTKNSKGTYSVWLDEGNIGEPTTIEKVTLIGGDKQLPIFANELSNCVIRKVIKL